MNTRTKHPSRRTVVLGGATAITAAALPRGASAEQAGPKVREIRLVAGQARTALAAGSRSETAVWAYNGQVPGPEIRIRQGDRVRITVENQLGEGTTVHWHGIRVPNAMDGVPHVTQQPIGRGASFVYEFVAPDAGTYWYHPHQNSSEQVGRGLYGPLIVEEESSPIPVDRDVVWVLSDWRLGRDAQITDDFENRHDMAHNGRIGNIVTLNGHGGEPFPVKAGERIRLRLINAANARIFSLYFEGHQPTVIAYDGQPIAPHAPDGGRVVLGPAMRADLILDLAGNPGQRYRVMDTFYRRLEYPLVELAYAEARLRDAPPQTPIALPANSLPEPDLGGAQRHEVTFDGGMMGRMMMGRGGDMMEMMRSGKIWFINGVAATGHVTDPLLTLARGRSYVLAMANETAWHHPMHLHGHSFRVISRNGEPTRHREWQDTVLMAPRERVEIAFVADNPGDWMFHCHILEHQVAGMMGIFRVA